MNEHLPNHALTAFDSLADERRAGVLDHVRACAECRAAWLAADSSRVFALLGRMPIPGRELDRLSARLDAALDREPPRIRPRRFLRVASIAASLLLALVLGAVLWNQEPTPGHAAASLPVEILPSPDEELAGIRFVETPGDEAQVLDLSVGGTQILMVFDESIEL